MKYDVFISYARKDYADEHKNVIPDNVISKIKDFLEENGYSYWFDEDGIYSGDEFVGVITEAIMNSEVFLFASSEASNNSEWTSHEIAVAKLLKKKTIPFKLDDSVYDKSILMYLAPLDHIEYFANPHKAFSALHASLKIHFSRIEEEKKKKIAEEELEKKKKEEAEARLKAEQNKKQRIATIEKDIANLLGEKQHLQSKKEAKLEQIKEVQEEVNYFDIQIKDKEKEILDLEREKYELTGSHNQKSQKAKTDTKTTYSETPTWLGGKSTGAFVIGIIVAIFFSILLLFIIGILNDSSEKNDQETTVNILVEENTDSLVVEENTESDAEYPYLGITYNANGVPFEMIPVESSAFLMGANKSTDSGAFDNEGPIHPVAMNDYYIGKHEVTQALWKAVMGSNPSNFKGDNLPVENVSWFECQVFINKLNTLTEMSFRLPTEAEWEYAARGGNRSRGYKYSGSDTISDVAWYHDNAGSTHPVGTKKANELGIHDMSGNVWEWCYDWYDCYYSSPQTAPDGPSTGSGRVIRGGSYWDDTKFCRSTYRYGVPAKSTDYASGLRLVLSP